MRRITALFLLSVLVSACASAPEQASVKASVPDIAPSPAPAPEEVAVKAPVSDFTRLEVRYGGFTKRFRESVFKIAGEGRYSVEALLPARTLYAGRNDFDIILRDSQDRNVHGALITVSAVKPEAGLKAEAAGVAEGGLAGLYAVENLSVPDTGHWKLVFTIMGAAGADTVSFDFSKVAERPSKPTGIQSR